MKIGLALAGGGARAIAHLGMMQVLVEHNITVDRVSGASAGAIAGALFCQGYEPGEILEIVKHTNFLKVAKPALSWKGLLKLESGYEELLRYLPHDRFEELAKPLAISATDIHKGKVKYFKKGQLILPILASCSIPVVFDPIIINGNAYMDGGIMDNLPYDPLRKKVDITIGMHCNPIDQKFRSNNWRGLMERALLLSISNATYFNKKRFDAFWEAPGVSQINVFDFKKADKLYRMGYSYAQKRVDELLELIENPVVK
jgi:NTE family protein